MSAAPRPIKLTIAALGGQGGGVLADWLVGIAEAEGYIAQSTSIPGVAQRTGATIYYLEFFPRAAAEAAGREPVLALMPVPGDVDCVLAAELAEAARAIQRGLVTRERTTLISSTHRSYVIAEKSALADGTTDSAKLLELLRHHAKHLILFDMQQTAERNHSVISSVLLGALCGSGLLPFRTRTFEAAIERSGIAVKANLAAFTDACARAQHGDSGFTAERVDPLSRDIPTQARTPALQPLLDRVRHFPACAQPVILEGTRRALDFQDPAYAQLYLQRLERIARLEPQPDGAPGAHGSEAGSAALLEATARSLALWMSFEDTIRVADLKTRASRIARVREEIRATPGQLFGITEFMKPRVAELAGTLPAALGRWVLRSPRVSRWLAGRAGGREVRTRTVGGFTLLYVIAGLRRWRRSTLRYREENARIEGWLARIEQLAPRHYALAIELARAQRIVKGYGETHERGWSRFMTLLAQLDLLALRSDGAAVLGRLQEAALADEEGTALAREIAQLQ
ncbi:MAG TPA: indolepyruvate oxidoreductase subunit beta family protein [Steroidobacteraceae bacterium]